MQTQHSHEATGDLAVLYAAKSTPDEKGSIPDQLRVARERADALFVAPDIFFVSRAVQFATLTARARIPATFANPDHVAAGGLMSYGTDVADTFRQVGVYTGSILKGAKAADLPVLQPTKFEFVINLQTARALGVNVPPELLAIADEAIE